MRKFAVLAVALLVSGCAEYNFTPMPNRPDTGVDMRTDLKNCEQSARDRYFSDPNVRARMITFGSMGGRGIPDMNADIELCMAIRGYRGSIN